MARMKSPNTRIDWYDESAFADPSDPKVLELNAGTNISCAIGTGYTLGFTDSDTEDSKSICDEGNRVTFTRDNYESTLSLFRAPIGATDAESLMYEAARAIFADGPVTGYLVSRHGKKSTEDYVAGDIISIFKFTSDYDRVTGDEGAIMMEVPFLQQGFAIPNLTVTA